MQQKEKEQQPGKGSTASNKPGFNKRWYTYPNAHLDKSVHCVCMYVCVCVDHRSELTKMHKSALNFSGSNASSRQDDQTDNVKNDSDEER